MVEQWKPCIESDYEVSNHGQVRRCKEGRGGTWKGRALKLSGNPYLKVCLFKNRKRNYRQVHTLVLTAFVGKRTNDMVCNHIDGDKHNNYLENLEWVTPLENIRHSIRTGLKKIFVCGEQNGRSKLTESNVRNMRRMHGAGHEVKDIARIFNIDKSHANKIILRRNWKHI